MYDTYTTCEILNLKEGPVRTTVDISKLSYPLKMTYKIGMSKPQQE